MSSSSKGRARHPTCFSGNYRIARGGNHGLKKCGGAYEEIQNYDFDTPVHHHRYCSLHRPAGVCFYEECTTYNTDGSLPDVQAAITNASHGDIVQVPPGDFTWGTGGAAITLNRAITLQGAGTDSTIISLAIDAPGGTAATIRLGHGAVVKDLQINVNYDKKTAFQTISGSPGDWRITNVRYVQATGVAACFIYANTYGLIEITAISRVERARRSLFLQGEQRILGNAPLMGGPDNLFIEKCTFRGRGHVLDFNSNARGVVRNCIIWGPIKVDAHGKSTNSPPRSARHWEVYRNSWPGDFGNYRSMELRGGTGRIWGNSSPQSTQGAFMMLTEYGVTGIFNTLYGRFVTPSRYPSDDQIGVGKDPRVGASEPVYLWSNRRAGAIWQIALGADPSSVSYLYATDAAGYPVGTTEITITAPGKWLPAGNYLAVAGDPNRYKVAVEHTTSGPNSTRFVIEAPGLRQAIPAAPTAITAGPLQNHQGGNRKSVGDLR